MGILLDGSYRENVQPVGVFNYIEKYTRTSGNAPDGMYCYNFCFHTNPYDLQPSGAMNMSRFKLIEFELSTSIPPTNELYLQSTSVCDPVSGQIVGTLKPSWGMYLYTFDFHLFEERYNIISFQGGNAGLMWAT